MASGIYKQFKINVMKGLLDLVNGTVKVALYLQSFAFTVTDTAYTTTNEVTGTGYSAGGATLANKSVAGNGNNAMFDADDSSWAASSFSAYFAALYSQSPCNTLICAIDFGGVQTVTNATLTITYASSGILQLQ